MVTIQKRTMIFVSDQAFISKWWWIGAIRKTRLPVVRKAITWIATDSASITKTLVTLPLVLELFALDVAREVHRHLEDNVLDQRQMLFDESGEILRRQFAHD